MVPVTAVELASVVNDAYRADPHKGRLVLEEHYAEEIELRHDPASPADGAHERSAFIAGQAAELEGFQRAMDDFRQEDVDVTADGDAVVLGSTLCGTLADGRLLRVPVQVRYELEDGSIRRLVATVDPASGAMLAEALAAAGFTVPN
jgi:ketosteroid isomerase-like protein